MFKRINKMVSIDDNNGLVWRDMVKTLTSKTYIVLMFIYGSVVLIGGDVGGGSMIVIAMNAFIFRRFLLHYQSIAESVAEYAKKKIQEDEENSKK